MFRHVSDIRLRILLILPFLSLFLRKILWYNPLSDGGDTCVQGDYMDIELRMEDGPDNYPKWHDWLPLGGMTPCVLQYIISIYITMHI